jgi:SWI/SNF-related matrix-associated actin-dependent regulator of chromatin subfamily A member 5
LIKRDIGEWPLFRFDWFFKSRTPEELRRRGATLLLLIMKDKEPEEDKKAKVPANKVCSRRALGARARLIGRNVQLTI